MLYLFVEANVSKFLKSTLAFIDVELALRMLCLIWTRSLRMGVAWLDDSLEPCK